MASLIVEFCRKRARTCSTTLALSKEQRSAILLNEPLNTDAIGASDFARPLPEPEQEWPASASAVRTTTWARAPPPSWARRRTGAAPRQQQEQQEQQRERERERALAEADTDEEIEADIEVPQPQKRRRGVPHGGHGYRQQQNLLSFATQMEDGDDATRSE